MISGVCMAAPRGLECFKLFFCGFNGFKLGFWSMFAGC